MDFTTILIIIAVIAVAAFYFLRRNRSATPGTYDDPKVRSSGSIGGDRSGSGTRAHDDPKVRSGGSIGGAKVYDTPEHKSTGSIGGQSQVARRNKTDGIEDDPQTDDDLEEPKHNDRGVKSGGSIGSA